MKTQLNAGGNFNGIAPFYDSLAFVVFGRRLQQAQLVWLNRIPPNASVLIIGGGAGWLLEQVLTRCQPKRVVYLETSTQMIARTCQRILRHSVLGWVDFRVGDETSLKPVDQFDVVLTTFVLDLFSETTLQTSFIPQVRNALNPGGLWLITDFIQPQIGWQKALLWIMIRFFRLTAGIEVRTLADWQQCLTQAGLTLQERSQQVGGMASAEVWIQGS